jgi:repressor of nif and glnA expression
MMQALADKEIKCKKKTVKSAIKNQFSLVMNGEKYKNRLHSIFKTIKNMAINAQYKSKNHHCLL